MTDKAQRASAAGALIAISTLLVGALAPSAFAQLGGTSLSDATQAVDAVSDTSGQIGDVIEGPTEQVGDAVEDTTGQVGDAVGDTGGQVGDAVGDTGGQVGDTIGGDVGGTIGDTTGSAGDTIGETSGSVGDAVGGAGGQVGDTIGGSGDDVDETVGRIGGALEDAVDGSPGGGIPGLIDDTTDPGGRTGALPPGFIKNSFAGNTDDLVAGSSGGSFGSLFGDANRIEGLDLGGTELVGSASDVNAPVGFGEYLEEALEAAKKFAFPLVLTLLVAAFMMVHGRLDKRDPKLAVAVIDPDEDLLSFS